VLIHRGLCGVNLRVQCMSIGVTYSFLSTIAIFMASMMIHNPIQYVHLENVKTIHEHKEISPNETNIEENEESATDELESLMNSLIKSVGQNGIEMLIGGIATLIVSLLLIQGIRTNKTSWILPWIVETIVSTLGGFFIFLVQVASPQSISVLKSFLVVCFFGITVYFILSVYSLYMIIKIQKRSVTHFLDHEFQSNEGSYYRPLGNGQEQTLPWREKKVPMNEQEDIDREHVLYAKM